MASHPSSRDASRWLSWLVNARPMIAIREGLLWTVPILLLSSLLLFLSVFGRLAGLPASLTDTLADLQNTLSLALPWIMSCAIGYMLATLYRLPQLPIAFFCLSQVVMLEQLFIEAPQLFRALSFPAAIFLPLISVPLTARLRRVRWMLMAPGSIASSTVRDALNMVLPGSLASLALVTIIYMLALPLLGLHSVQPMMHWLGEQSPYLLGPLLAAAGSVSWFFGVHGTYLLQPVLDMIDQISSVLPGYQLDRSTLFVFGHIGGSGATLSLIGAILLFSRQKTQRMIALLSLPTALINVNEILLFGLPLILNPRLLLPFVLTPALNMAVTLAVVQAGWLTLQNMALPFTTPILLNAYTLSDGSLTAMALQCALVLLGIACYAPTIRAMQRSAQASQVHIKSMDITFSRLQETSLLLTREPISQALSQRMHDLDNLQQMQQISDCQFHLEYQPHVSLLDGRCAGCEALLRIQTPDGEKTSAWKSLQWLKQAGLMPEVDLWVARQAVQQQHEWQARGFRLPMTINVTSATLTEPSTRQRLLGILAKAQGMVSVELTEDMLIGDEAAIRQTFAQLHAIGAQIYIDDFGTGYAALSHLYSFDVDAIKLDRSFILASDTPKGIHVLSGILHMCHGLGLRVIVEGVETCEQLQTLDAACEDDVLVQGWYFSKALDAEQLQVFAMLRQPRPSQVAGIY